MNSVCLRHAARGVFAFLLATVTFVVSAQTPGPGRETSAASVASLALGDQMPVDPEVLVGALPNGLRFYVRPNGKPARQVELRLVVKAGSVLEDDDQQGLAHFVEHMQFEGTAHFPGQGINNFLGELGLSLGADANAETSFDETQYTLRVPTDVPGALDRALTILEDWAGSATFDPSGIERQRPIVLAEWRMNLGADERTADKIRRVQLEGSRYADRSPIGIPDTIQRATREQLMRFYRDWYRPDLMAVIVVGDVDRAARGADDRAALPAARQSVAGAAEAGIRRPGSSGRALRGRDRQGNDRDRRPGLDAAAGAQPGLGRRLSRDHEGSVVRRHARRAPRRAHSEREAAIPAGRRESVAVSGTKDERPGACSGARLERRRDTRSRCPGDRSPARPTVRICGYRARPGEAGEHGRVRTRGRGESRSGVVKPRRRVHPQLPPERGAADDLAGARVSPALHSRPSR